MKREKVNNSKKIWKRTFNYFLKYKIEIIAIIFFCVVESLIGVFSPKLSGKGITALSAVDAVGNPSVDMNYIFELLSFLLVLYSIDALCSCLGRYFLTKVSVRMVYDIRNEISSKINKVSFKYLEKRERGDLLSCAVSDAETLGTNLIGSICSTISSLILGIGTFFMMVSISWEITLLFFVILPLMLGLVSLILKISQKYFLSYRKKLGEMNGCLEETFSGYEMVKALGMENYLKNKFDAINFSLKQDSDSANFLSGLMGPSMGFLSNLLYVVCCVVGGYLAIVKRMQIGDITAIIAYSSKITQPLIDISAISGNFQTAFAASQRIFELLDAPEESKASESCSFSNLDIEFKNVSFGYDPNKMVLKGVSFKIKSGESVAIVGETGGGKTTILNLLMRFYDVSSGSIFIGGKNITSLDIKEYRKYFGIVTQDSWLYSSEVMQNIRYGNLSASNEDVIQTVEFLGLDSFINSLPSSYDTVIQESASNLSEGQKQIICIARAAFSKRLILILDEATSSIDTSLESCLQESLAKALCKKTSVIVAHRLSTIKNADLILVVKDGRIEERGKHEELLLKRGIYYDMYSKTL